jgi:N-acetyl-anhydromuramyl-L-alanine amidase AmpD
MHKRCRSVALAFAGLLSGCYLPERTPAPQHRAPPLEAARDVSAPTVDEAPLAHSNQGDSIVICGHRVHTGAPVVLWTEAPYYDATKEGPWFQDPEGKKPGKKGLRYQPGRVRNVVNPDFVPAPQPNEPDERTELQKQPTVTETIVPRDALDPELLATVVDQFVLHYDVCGLSRTCFRVLQDERMLSVHFMLDLDGTIYQTMDLRDTAWHATKSNGRSIGIEIANMGAYAHADASVLADWYRRDTVGTYVSVPARIVDTGIRTPGFVARPARDAPVIGVVQKTRLEQYDFTPEQYESLSKLAAVLCRELPKIAPDAPRDEHGAVVDHVLDDDEWRDFHGILGHFHVQQNKTDPGPAMHWEPFLERVRARLEEIRHPGGGTGGG